MDDYSDDFPFWESVETKGGPKPLVVVPYAIDTNDMKMWVAPSLQPWDWSRYAMTTFDVLHAEARAGAAKILSIGLHLRIVGRPGRADALREVLDHIAARDDIWVASRGAIAAHFAAQCPP